MKKPVVLTFSGYYLPGYKGGGPIRTLVNMVERLGDDISFRIVTTDRDLGDDKPYPGIKPYRWQRVGKAQVKYLDSKGLSFKALRQLLNSTGHDILYLNSLFSPDFTIKPLLLRRLGLVPRRPLIIAPRGELSKGALTIKRHKKALYLLAAKFIGLYSGVLWQASSDYEAGDIRAAFGDRVQVTVAPDLPSVPVAVEGEWVEEPKEAGKLNIVFLSRISPKKNLIGALKLLYNLKGTVDFNIYGPKEDMEYWEECSAIIDSLPANIKVSYKGTVEHHEVPRIFRRHHLFLFPTLGENFGHVIHESLAAGCPVMISDATPWRQLADKGVGWDIPLADIEGYKEILQQLVDMDEPTYRQWSVRAREYGMAFSRDQQILKENKRLFYRAVGGAGQ